MEWIEADPLPEVCQKCQEEDCWECDHAGKRWYLPEADKLELRRKGLMKAVERLQRQITELDQQIIKARKKCE